MGRAPPQKVPIEKLCSTPTRVVKIGFVAPLIVLLSVAFSAPAKAELYGGISLLAGATQDRHADPLGQAGLGLKLGGRSEQLGGYLGLSWLVTEDIDPSAVDLRVGQFFIDGGLDIYVDWLRLTGFAGLATASAVAEGDTTLIATGTSLGGGAFVALASSPKFDLDLGASAREVFYTLKDDQLADDTLRSRHYLVALNMTWH